MALSGKYGKLDISQIGKDEPIFILRAQDKLAAPTIEMYRLLLSSHQSPMVRSLEKEIDNFHRWSGKKKMPD